MGEPSVLASIVETLLRAAARAGLPADLIAAQAGLAGWRLDDPEARVPFRIYAAAWEEVLTRVRDEPFGLQLAQAVDAATYGIVGYLSATSTDVGTGFAKSLQFLRLITERGVGTVEEQDDGNIRYAFAPIATTGVARHHTEAMVAAFVTCARKWSGVHIRPEAVFFRHAEPPSTTAHAELFGCPVHFGAAENAIVLSPSTARTPLRMADPALHTILLRRAESLLSSLPSRSDLLRDVEGIVKEHLAEGAPTVSFVAKQLGLSSRTLQRRLAGEGVSFAGLLDRYRREASLRLLEDEQLSIHDISMMLGFSEPKAFRRAFKRWTGLSPRAHRHMRRLGHLSVAA